MSGRRPALERAQHRGDGEVWIDHAKLAESDQEWLQDVEHLTLWNVTAPPGFLARLPRLWLLDVRGGSGSDLRRLEGCESLRGLVVNQVQGLNDLSALVTLTNLEFLSVYGLKQVLTIPSLEANTHLRRVDVGRMTGLSSLGGLLEAPALEELFVVGKVAVTDEDVARIRSMGTVRSFDWFADGQVPDKRWVPVCESLGLPKAKACFPREWFRLREP